MVDFFSFWQYNDSNKSNKKDSRLKLTLRKEECSMIYGYARISTPKQNIDRQVRNILAVHPDAKIIKEVFTGTKFQGRKEFDRLLKLVHPEDTIVFDSVSRMSRSEDEGCIEYEKLFNRGITLEFLKEPHINTETYKKAMSRQLDITLNTGHTATDTFMNTMIEALNRYMIDLAKDQIRLAFAQAQKEVDDLRQRTTEGIETARRNGKQIGRVAGHTYTTKKSLPAKEIIRKHNKNFGGSLSNEETWKLAGISKMTFYKYQRELLEEIAAESQR